MENLFNDKLGMVYTAQPATIVLFNASDNTVNCTLDKEGIELQDIPISLFGNPTSYITTPTLESGTKGLLLFSKHDLYSWVEDGTDAEAKPNFSKNNAFFLIGATNQKNKITYNLDAIEIKTDKSIEQIADKHIHLTAPQISLINSASNEELFALLVNTLDEMKALATTLSQSKDKTYNLLLTNSTEIATYINKFGDLSSKYGSFQ